MSYCSANFEVKTWSYSSRNIFSRSLRRRSQIKLTWRNVKSGWSRRPGDRRPTFALVPNLWKKSQTWVNCEPKLTNYKWSKLDWNILGSRRRIQWNRLARWRRNVGCRCKCVWIKVKLLSIMQSLHFLLDGDCNVVCKIIGNNRRCRVRSVGWLIQRRLFSDQQWFVIIDIDGIMIFFHFLQVIDNRVSKRNSNRKKKKTQLTNDRNTQDLWTKKGITR